MPVYLFNLIGGSDRRETVSITDRFPISLIDRLTDCLTAQLRQSLLIIKGIYAAMCIKTHLDNISLLSGHCAQELVSAAETPAGFNLLV